LAALIFWSSVAVVAYVYFGYPLILFVWTRFRKRQVRKSPCEPTVSLIIAAHNERQFIERKLRNCLELQYPRDKLRIIVSLDGPTDGTDTLALAFEGEGVEVISSSMRQGKAAALNRAVLRARGDLLLFADARQVFAPNVIRELSANFADPEVGVVSGELILAEELQHEAGNGVGLYWRYEKLLRSMESSIHSMLGATGAIYSMRRELYRPLSEGTILDDVVLPMHAVLNHRRAVFDPAARAFDPAVSSPEIEYSRKVRTLTGNYQLLHQLPDLLVPWRNPVFFQFVSHKVGRLLAPYFLIALFCSNLFLLHGFYLISLALQAAWYLLVPIGVLISRNSRPTAAHASAFTTREACKP
jgi:cellulose synthase/poly-beta-1,6-N-acetylglucosamine synthase-like glycosyltransferase